MPLFKKVQSGSFVFILFLFFSPATWAKNVINFQGSIDFLNNKLDVVLDVSEESRIVAKAGRNVEDFYLTLALEHFKTDRFDLSSQIESSFTVKQASPADNSVVEGKIWSQYSLVNYKPIRELSGQFQISKGSVHLDNLSFGNILCQGFVELQYPFNVDLTFDLNSMGLKDFIDFWVQNKEYESSGEVSGKIKVLGNLDKFALKGKLESSKGFVDKLDYDSIRLNVEGIYPHMTIANSTVSQTNGMIFSIDGPFDLSDHENFKKQIKSLNISPLVSNTESESQWTIRKSGGNDSTSTELILRKDGSVNSQQNNDSHLLGVQRTMGF